MTKPLRYKHLRVALEASGLGEGCPSGPSSVSWGPAERVQFPSLQLQLSRKRFLFPPLFTPQPQLIPLWGSVRVSLALFGGRWPLALSSSTGSMLLYFSALACSSGPSPYITDRLRATGWEKAGVLLLQEQCSSAGAWKSSRPRGTLSNL